VEAPINHSLVNALRAVPSLGSLDDRTLLAIVGESSNLAWSAGSKVFEKDSPGDGLYIVLSGGVRVAAADGAEIAVLAPGAYFGEFSLLLGTDHQHDVVAVEDTELMVVPKECFDAIVSDNPELARSLRDTVEERRNSRAAAAG
jgi:CRP-like cAMP-binding protein